MRLYWDATRSGQRTALGPPFLKMKTILMMDTSMLISPGIWRKLAKFVQFISCSLKKRRIEMLGSKNVNVWVRQQGFWRMFLELGNWQKRTQRSMSSGKNQHQVSYSKC